MTVKFCNRLALGAPRLRKREFIAVFHLFQHVLC